MDGRLLAQARDGDRVAFETLVAEHAPLGWRLAYALTGSHEQAAETLTTGASRAFGRRTPMFAASAPHVELSHAVRVAAIDLLEQTGDPRPYEVPDGAHQDLALAFADLPERSRTALWLHHVEALADAETAFVLDVPEEYADSLVDRARDGLRERYVERHVQMYGGRNCDRAVARLGAHAAGRLPENEIELVERHLRLCPTCRDRAMRLATITRHLSEIVPPMPDLTDDIRTAWALLAPSAGWGPISSVGEKVIAGVSAAAAAVAVVGAAMAASSDGSGDGQVVPTEAVVADLTGGGSAPDGESDDLRAGRTPFEPTPAEPPAELSTVLAQDRVAAPPASPPAVAHRVTDADAGPAGAPITATGPSGAPPVDDTDEPDAPAPAEPIVSVGTQVGDVPVAADVGTEPGLTVGPVSIGSEPQPGDELIELDGPLDGLVDEPLDDLGL